MKKIIKGLLNRLKEGSSWRGLVLIVMAYYLKTTPEHIAEILASGLSINGILGVLIPEKKSE